MRENNWQDTRGQAGADKSLDQGAAQSQIAGNGPLVMLSHVLGGALAQAAVRVAQGMQRRAGARAGPPPRAIPGGYFFISVNSPPTRIMFLMPSPL